MHHARHPLTLAALTIAMLTGLVACKPATPEAAEAEANGEAAGNTAPVPASNTTPPATAELVATTPPATAPATTDPAAHDAVVAAMRKLSTLRSYRVTILDSDGQKASVPNKLDYVAPDRYRMETPGMAAQVVIGDTLYTTVDGRTKASPAPVGTTSKWRGPMDFLATGTNFTVEAGANRFVFGIPSLEYRIRVAEPVASEMSLWIGPNGLPVKLESKAQPGGNPLSTVRKYSHYDNPTIKIDPPK